MPRAPLDDIATLRKVAKWFYQEELPKVDICKRLESEIGEKIDRRAVNRALKRARDEGVVVIDFPDIASQERRFEGRLREKFPHLRKVIVVRDQDHYGDLLASWGHAAARYFDELVAEGGPDGHLHVGISGGETLLSFVNAVSESPRKHVHLHTTALIGRGLLPDGASHVDPLVNATILWSKCGRLPGRNHYATVSPYDALTRSEIAEELLALSKRKAIRRVIVDIDKIDVVFAGLGLVKAGTPNVERVNQLTMMGLLGPMISPDELAMEGAIGDLSYCLFDKNGDGKKEWEFFLTAGYYSDTRRRGLRFFQQMVSDQKEKKKVVVIAGSHKRAVIRPALGAKLFNIWITDADTAEWALEKC